MFVQRSELVAGQRHRGPCAGTAMAPSPCICRIRQNPDICGSNDFRSVHRASLLESVVSPGVHRIWAGATHDRIIDMGVAAIGASPYRSMASARSKRASLNT
ncbi:hypothetical protein BKA10_001366 [Microbacterium invictum]|uniref:Uncharacterized protein n=1 Tax=Microbacterium invictum TaxID=515415 RepID=A0AA40SNX0_9MICO|nr:hypothetical protein [Microbacterium invictum]